jgi:hypothetical protein
MKGWINGLTVYNVHVLFEISAQTIYDSWFLSDIALCNLPINGLWLNNSKFDMKKNRMENWNLF